MSDLFDKYFPVLVPHSGQCDTVEGEMLRAINRILYRNYNDGDRIGRGMGKETCDPSARYLMRVCRNHKDENIASIPKRIDKLSRSQKTTYYKRANAICEVILKYIDSLDGVYTPNSEDMHDS